MTADTSKAKGSFDQRQALRPGQDQQIKDDSKPSGIEERACGAARNCLRLKTTGTSVRITNGNT